MRTRFLLPLLAAALLALPISRAEEPAPQVRFGILRADLTANKYVLAQKTTELPRRFKDSGFRWGFDVTPAEAAVPYVLQFIVHLPAPPDQVTGDLGKNNPQKPSDTIASAQIKVAGGRIARVFWFDPGDPPGEWSIDVLVNDRLVRSVAFKVYNE